MATPRRTFNKKRQNALWLMNAASLVAAIGALNQLTKSSVGNVIKSLVPSAQATTYTWNGASSDSLTTAGNWVGGVSGVGGSKGTASNDTQSFGTAGTGRMSITMSAGNKVFGTVTFDALSNTYNSGWTISDNNTAALVMIAGDSALANATKPSFNNNYTVGNVTFNTLVANVATNNTWTGVTGSNTIFQKAVYMSDSTSLRTLTVNGGGNFTFSGGIKNAYSATAGSAATTAVSSTVTISNTGTTLITGAIDIRGQFNINTQGGIVELNGDNSAVGANLTRIAGTDTTYAFRLTQGKVLLDHQLALGTQDQVLGRTTGTLSSYELGVYTNAAINVANNFTLGASTGSNNVSGGYTLGGNAAYTSTFSGTVLLNKNSRFTQVTGGTLTFSNAITSTGSNNLTFDGDGNINVSGSIGAGITPIIGSASTSSTRVVTLSGTNAFTTGVTINSGVLALGSTGTLNENAITWGASTANGTLRLNGNSAVVKSLTTSSSPGTPIIDNGNAINGTLTIGNASNADSTFAGVIKDGTGGGTLGINVAGTGVLTLSGTNTYTGDTNIVSGGKLKLTGSLASGNTMNIASGGTLYGTGAANGTVKISGTVNPGSAGVGTLTTGATDLQSGGILNIQFRDANGTAGSTGWDLLSTGALTTSANSGGKFNINLISISSVGADTAGTAIFNNALNNQTFEIIRASSLATAFDVSNFNLIPVFTNSLNGGQWTLTSSNNSIYATFIIPTNLYWSAGSWGSTVSGSGGAGSWADVSGAWDSSQTAIFAGSSAGLVNVGTVTSASGIIFSTTGYTLSGGTITLSGGSATVNTITTDAGINAVIGSSLSGINGLFKSGTGTLTLSGDNSSLSGGITVSGGTLQVGNNKALGVSASSVTLSSGTVLDLYGSTITNPNALIMSGNSALANTGTNASYAGNISGTGNLTINPAGTGNLTISGNINQVGAVTITPITGGGNTTLSGNIGSSVTGLTYGTANTTGAATTLLLSGTNTYTGTVTINTGTVKLGSSSAFGAITNSVVASGYASGVAIDLNGQTTQNPISIYGTGAYTNTGVITNSSTNAATVSGVITLPGTQATIGATSGDITLSGAIKTSSSTNRAITLIGNTSYATNIYVNSGVLGGASSPGFLQLTVGSGGSDKVKVYLQGTQTLQTNGNIKINGGNLYLATSTTASFAGMSMNSGGSTGDNSSLTLTAGNDYSFNSLGIGGALSFESTSSAASPASITFTGGGIASTNAANYGQTGSSGKNIKAGSGVTVIIGTSTGPTTYFDLVGANLATQDKILKFSNDGNFIFNSVIRENPIAVGTNPVTTFKGGLNKTGTGTLTLNAANTYTGGTTVSAGTLKVGNATALGADASTVAVSAGATLDLNGTTMTSTNALTLSGTITNTNATKATYAGLITIGGSTVPLSANATITASAGDIDISNTGTIGLTTGTGFNLTLNGDKGGTISSIIAIGTGALNKSGAGNWILSGANTYTGLTNITGGTLTLGASNVIGTGAITINGGTLAIGANSDSVQTITLTSGSITGSGGSITSSSDLNVVSGTISANLAGAVGLNKTGAGTVTITSAQTYSDTTAINAGVLKVNNSLATSGISIATGAKLEGQATLSAPVVVANNGIITSGDSSIIDPATRGSLTLSQITFLGSAEIKLANINTGTSASILNAGSIFAQGVLGSLITLTIDNADPLDNNTPYTLLKYGSLNDFSVFKLGVVGGTNSRQILSLENINNSITLTAAGDTVKWKGDPLSTPLWTSSVGNLNWKLSSSEVATDYYLGDAVTFDDSATSLIVTIAENVSPNLLTFNNSLLNIYEVNSLESTSFGINGSSGLLKNGTGRVNLNAPLRISDGITVNDGTLALNNPNNTFTGNIILNGSAILELGASGALGTGNSLTFGPDATGKLSLNSKNGTLTGLSTNAVSLGSPIVENGGSTDSTLTLNINSSSTSAFSGLIRDGDGTTGKLLLTKSGNGTLVLNSDNTNTGLTTINGGKLQLGNSSTTGSLAGNISINAAGTLDFSRTNKLSYSSALSGSGIVNLKSGQLELLGTNTFTGAMNIFSGTTLTVGSTGSISSSMAMTNNGTFVYNSSTSAYSLGAIAGTGSLSILANTVTQTGTNSLTGSINIGTGATYAIATNGSFTSASSVINDGTLSFGARSADFTFNKDVSGAGNLVSNIGSGLTFFVTGNNTYTGTTTISSGKLNLGNSGGTGSLGTGGIVIAKDAELILSKNIDTIISGGITGAGSITLGGTGRVTLSSSSPINLTDANSELKFGSTVGSTVHSTLDLSNSSATVGKFTVQTDATNNLSASNSIIIGADKSLYVKGLVTIGLNNGSNPTTNLAMSGDGSFNVGTSLVATNSDIIVGASNSNSKINYVSWDMNALSNMYSNLGTGKFVIGGDVNGSGGVGASGDGVTVKLPTTTTIIATTLLMDAVEPKTFILSLGAGVNTLNVDTLTVGGANTRGTNNFNFNSGTGTLFVRNKAGSGRATLNVQAATNSTGSNQISSVDLSNHSVDLLLSTVTVGQRLSLTGSGSGYGSGYLAFDTGIFDATTLNIANKSHNGTAVGTLYGKISTSTTAGNVVGLVSFGGGTVNIGSVDLARHGASNVGGTAQGLIEFLGSNTSTVGAVTMASAASALVSGTPSVTGSINIDGGSVYIASINGASAALNTGATANLNVSGGTLTMGGNITQVGGLGTSAFNLNLSGGILNMGGNITRTSSAGTSDFNLYLNGGTLDMGGFAIGTTGAGSNVNLSWTKGTLKNVSGLNGTDGITVNTSALSETAYLDGTNTFSKITIKDNGLYDSILQLKSTTALGVNSKIGFDGTKSILQLGSGVNTDVSSNLSSGNAQFDTNSNDVTFASSVSGLTSFSKLGIGKLTLSSSSGSLAPSVSILCGSLELGTGNSAIPGSGFLYGTNAISLDGAGLVSAELIANAVKVDLNADVNFLNSGATISGTKGAWGYSFNFIKDIISQDKTTATISATDMIMGVNSHINVRTDAILTISGSFIDDGANATQINKTGTGLLELTGSGNTYSGATTVNAGTLSVYQGALTNASTAITVKNTAILTATDLGADVSITVAAGGTADISGTDFSLKDIVSDNSTPGAFSFSGSDGKISAKSLSGSGSTTFGSDLEVDTLDGAGSVDLSGIAPTLTVGAGTFTGILSSSGTAALVKKGSGTLTLNGANNTLTGPVTLNGGILSVNILAELGAATDATENLVLQGGKLQYTGAGDTMTRGFTIGDGESGFIASGTGALIIQGDMDFADATASNRTLSLGGLSNIPIANIYNPSKFDSNDLTNLFTKLVKQDTNKWIVLGAGAGFVDESEIDILDGTLGFGTGALGRNPSIMLGSTTQVAPATLAWVNDPINNTPNSDDISGRITLRDSAHAAFDIPTNNTVSFLGGINGGLNTSLTKTGAGTLELHESSPFSGGLTISGGTVKAFKAGSVGTGSVTVGTGAPNSISTLVVNANLLNPITVNSDSTLTTDNSDQSVDDITVAGGGTILPGGEQIGTMTVRNLTLKGGSSVNWQMSDATGPAGIGYDTFILNTLLLTDASLSNRVTIHVRKNIFGDKAENFDANILQSFQFAKLTEKLDSSYTNVTSLFDIEASQFEYINGLPTDQLVWHMTVSADREYLYITAMAIPEPSTYGLGLGSLALAAAAIRRRKQKKNPSAV